MIRIAAASDLHIECDYGTTLDGGNPLVQAMQHDGHPTNPRIDWRPIKAANPDLVILAGDIGRARKQPPAVGYANQVALYLQRPVVLIPGNHEFYGESHETALDHMRAQAEACEGDVIVLERDVAYIPVRQPDGSVRSLRVFGCIYWSDYAAVFRDRKVGRTNAENRMNDHRQIRRNGGAVRWSTGDALSEHFKASAWLEEVVAVPHDGPTAIVTHHGPSLLATAPKHRTDGLVGAFVSEEDAFVAASGAAVWFCGHTHWDCDEMIGSCRLYARQGCYPGERRTLYGDGEPEFFVPGLITID